MCKLIGVSDCPNCHYDSGYVSVGSGRGSGRSSGRGSGHGGGHNGGGESRNGKRHYMSSSPRP